MSASGTSYNFVELQDTSNKGDSLPSLWKEPKSVEKKKRIITTSVLDQEQSQPVRKNLSLPDSAGTQKTSPTLPPRSYPVPNATIEQMVASGGDDVIPNVQAGLVENASEIENSTTEKLMTQSISESNSSLKFASGKAGTNISSSSSKASYKQFKKLEKSSFGSDGNSENKSLSSSVRKTLAFSAEKQVKDLASKEGDITKNGSFSISSSTSLQSTLESGSFSIRKIIDEKIEISRNENVLPQFSLTSMSSASAVEVEGKVTPEKDQGTLPSCPSSYTDPSFKNISGESVSKLLGSTFKKTENFLKKLEKLDLPDETSLKSDGSNASVGENKLNFISGMFFPSIT